MPTTPEPDHPNKNRILFGLIGVLVALSLGVLALGWMSRTDIQNASKNDVERTTEISRDNQAILREIRENQEQLQGLVEQLQRDEAIIARVGTCIVQLMIFHHTFPNVKPTQEQVAAVCQ